MSASEAKHSIIYFAPINRRKISLAEALRRFPEHNPTCHVVEGLPCDCEFGRLRAQNIALLEALEDLCEWLERRPAGIHPEGIGQYLQARAAIAQAEETQ